MEWIKVEDRLPGAYEPVQILTSYKKQATAYMNDDTKPSHGWVDWMRPQHTYGSVTHWGLLHELPEE